jgi:hypothetical protein
MGLRIIIAAALAVALLGFLGFRIFDLEQRVAALSRQLEGSDQAATAATTDTGDAGVSGLGYEARLAALEKRVDGIRATMRRLDKASGLPTGLGVGGQPVDKEILSVVERENSRLRDVQLEWQRARWLESREASLAIFARHNNLTTEQNASLQQTLEHEVDAMVEVLRRPNLLEDPDQAANDWQALLEATDRTAGQVLTPAQAGQWYTARAFERRVLWPWLPGNTLNK